MKKRISEFEKKEFENHEQFKSLKMFIKLIRNTLNSIVNSDFIISKKLFDSSIFIDKKNSNIKN
jgi:hypothetical protein